MSDFLKSQAIKMAINLIGTETINEGINTLIAKIVDYAKSQPLEEGETQVTGLLYENQNQLFYAIVAFNDNNQIVRYIEDKPVNEFVENIVSNLKNI